MIIKRLTLSEREIDYLSYIINTELLVLQGDYEAFDFPIDKTLKKLGSKLHSFTTRDGFLKVKYSEIETLLDKSERQLELARERAPEMDGLEDLEYLIKGLNRFFHRATPDKGKYRFYRG